MKDKDKEVLSEIGNRSFIEFVQNKHREHLRECTLLKLDLTERIVADFLAGLKPPSDRRQQLEGDFKEEDNMICWWCTWGWPQQIADIYLVAYAALNFSEFPLRYGPAHIVWEGEKFDDDSIKQCLREIEENPDTYGLPDGQLRIIEISLRQLLGVSDEYRQWPELYKGLYPEAYPPPEHWTMVNIRQAIKDLQLLQHKTELQRRRDEFLGQLNTPLMGWLREKASYGPYMKKDVKSRKDQLLEELAELLSKDITAPPSDDYSQLSGGVKYTDEGVLSFVFTKDPDEIVTALTYFLSDIILTYAPGEPSGILKQSLIKLIARHTLSLIERVYEELGDD